MGHLAWNGRVIAYEADPKIYELLVSNVSMNWCERNVEPVNAAVAAEVGELTLHRWLHRSGNTGVIAPPPELGRRVRKHSPSVHHARLPRRAAAACRPREDRCRGRGVDGRRGHVGVRCQLPAHGGARVGPDQIVGAGSRRLSSPHPSGRGTWTSPRSARWPMLADQFRRARRAPVPEHGAHPSRSVEEHDSAHQSASHTVAGQCPGAAGPAER